MQTPSPITARPVVYIDLLMPNGTKQVLQVDVARAMHEQLGIALASIDAVPAASENDPQSALPLQDDQDSPDDDDSPLAAGVGFGRSA